MKAAINEVSTTRRIMNRFAKPAEA